MKRGILLVALAALTLIAMGCKKTPDGETASKILSILGAPRSAVLVGEKFSLTVEKVSGDLDGQTVEWSSTNPAVAKVNASGRVLATGKGECEILASVGEASDKISVVVNDRNPATDEMGHVGSGKTNRGQNNSSVSFSVFDTGWQGEIWYQGGNNSMTYYENGTFQASWKRDK